MGEVIFGVVFKARQQAPITRNISTPELLALEHAPPDVIYESSLGYLPQLSAARGGALRGAGDGERAQGLEATFR